MKTLQVIIVSAFVLFFCATSANFSYSQEKQSMGVDKQKMSGSTTREDLNKTKRDDNRVDEIYLKRALENYDRTLNLLNIVIGALSLILTGLAILIAVLIGVGLFERRKMKLLMEDLNKDVSNCRDKIRHIEEDAITAAESRKRIEQIEEDTRILRERIKEEHIALPDKPSEEIKEKLDEFSRKFELLETLGVPLKFEDYMNRATDHYFKNKFDSALKMFEKAIELKPVDRDAWYNKGVSLIKLKRYKDALRAFDEAIRLKPDYPKAWCNKGMALGKLDRNEDALRAFDEAIRLKPDDPDAWYNKACVYSLMVNKTEALSSLEKAIKLDPKYKKMAREDEDFKLLWDDDDFKKITE